jgi:hypothetical protein
MIESQARITDSTGGPEVKSEAGNVQGDRQVNVDEIVVLEGAAEGVRIGGKNGYDQEEAMR